METWTGVRTGRERERGREWRPVDKHKIGTGTEAGAETRAVAEMETGIRMGTGTGRRTGSGMAEKRQRSAIDRTRVVDAMRNGGDLGGKRKKRRL